MNVKISLSVPIEEVENEVSKILENCNKRLYLISEEISKTILDDGNPTVQFQKIQEIRKKMTVVDLKLEDSYSILKGLIQYKMSQSKKEIANDGDQKEQSDQNTTG